MPRGGRANRSRSAAARFVVGRSGGGNILDRLAGFRLPSGTFTTGAVSSGAPPVGAAATFINPAAFFGGPAANALLSNIMAPTLSPENRGQLANEFATVGLGRAALPRRTGPQGSERFDPARKALSQALLQGTRAREGGAEAVLLPEVLKATSGLTFSPIRDRDATQALRALDGGSVRTALNPRQRFGLASPAQPRGNPNQRGGR